MEDPLGGLAGSGGSSAGRPDLARLEEVFAGAGLLGLEIDTRFRVLAVTLEPTVERYAWGEADDRRVQVLCFPVSTILGSLRREDAGGRELLEFDESQLVDVAGAFAGETVQTPIFGRPEPRPGSWGPRFSLEGRSSAPDGVQRTVTISVSSHDLTLDLFARFDDLRLRDSAGTDLPELSPG